VRHESAVVLPTIEDPERAAGIVQAWQSSRTHDALLAEPQAHLERVAERLPADAPIQARAALAVAWHCLDLAAGYARAGDLARALATVYKAGAGGVEVWLLTHAPKALSEYRRQAHSAEARQEAARRWPARVAELTAAKSGKPGVTAALARSEALSAALAEYNAERAEPVARRSFERLLSRWRKAPSAGM